MAEIRRKTKTQIALEENIKILCELYGNESVGVITLTFKSNITDIKYAHKIFHVFSVGVLNRKFRAHIRKTERQEKGRVHFHIVVVKHEGQEWSCIKRFIKKIAYKYGFGISHAEAMKSNAAALAEYLCKEDSEERHENDKGIRKIAYSKAAKFCSTVFSSFSRAGIWWRQKLQAFVMTLITANIMPASSTDEDLKKFLGKHWCIKWRNFIYDIKHYKSYEKEKILEDLYEYAAKFKLMKKEFYYDENRNIKYTYSFT